MAEVVWRSSWIGVWTRAVVEPASRRAGAVWLGSGIVAAVMFGPTGVTPPELTRLALHNVGFGLAFAAIWLLMFVPIARVVVRADAARYLRALPGRPLAARLVGAAALVVMQLPWLALWVLGQGLVGLVVVAATTIVAVAIARWQPPALHPSTPVWTHPRSALRAIYLRALRRRAGDAITRGIGLSILAGMTGGLLVRNNELAGASAAVLGTGVISVVIVAAVAGLLVTLVDAHRSSAWLASSLGISPITRAIALASAAAAVYLTSTAIAVVAMSFVIGASSTVLWLALTAIAISLASALAVTRGLLAAEYSEVAAQKVVIASVLTAAAAVIWLGLLGLAGIAAMAATAVAMLFTSRVRE
jgi:hypothetical protein